MAAHDEDASGGGRLLALIALLALVVTAAVAFGRVFQGRGPTLRLVAAVSLSVLLGWAFERRHILLAAAVSLAGMALATTYLVFPDTLRHGLPSPTTLRVLRETLALVGHTAQVQAAPALPLPPLMLAALTAAWAAAFAAHALVARARSPLLGILPPAALLAFTGLVLDDGVRPGYVLPFLVATIVVLFLDALHRVRHWGPLTMWRGPGGPRSGLAVTGRAAQRLGALTVLAAALGAFVLPGFRSPGVLRLNHDQVVRHVSIDPIVDLKPSLLNTSAIPVFTVRSVRPAYWRFLALDTFTGRVWTSSNIDGQRGRDVGSGPLILDNPPLSQPAEGDSITITQHFDFQKLSQPWLPAAFDAVALSVRGAALRYDAEAGTLAAPNGTYPGFSYDVASQLVVPTPAQLDAVPAPRGSLYGRYTELPADTPATIFDIAHRLTDEAPTMYDKVLVLQNYLRTFRYDVNVPAGHDANHIIRFLTKTKAGYCEQFAGSMAVLLRALGIPARVAVGFTPGRFVPDSGTWQVTAQNAHAWVEVLFPGFGWLAFEPTPTRSNPVSLPYTDPVTVPQGAANACPLPVPGACAGQGATGTTPAVGRGGQLGRNTNPRQELVPDAGGGVDAAPEGSGRLGRGAVEIALALLLLLGLAIPSAKVLRRRAALVRARAPRERVLAAFDLLARDAADLGLGRRPAETLLEYRSRLKEGVSALDGDLDRLTASAGLAAYAEEGPSGADAALALASARRVRAEIRRAQGPARRAAAWFRVESLRR